MTLQFLGCFVCASRAVLPRFFIKYTHRHTPKTTFTIHVDTLDYVKRMRMCVSMDALPFFRIPSIIKLKPVHAHTHKKSFRFHNACVHIFLSFRTLGFDPARCEHKVHQRCTSAHVWFIVCRGVCTPYGARIFVCDVYILCTMHTAGARSTPV